LLPNAPCTATKRLKKLGKAFDSIEGSSSSPQEMPPSGPPSARSSMASGSEQDGDGAAAGVGGAGYLGCGENVVEAALMQLKGEGLLDKFNPVGPIAQSSLTHSSIQFDP
jgi:hypothetical protein